MMTLKMSKLNTISPPGHSNQWVPWEGFIKHHLIGKGYSQKKKFSLDSIKCLVVKLKKKKKESEKKYEVFYVLAFSKPIENI